MSNNLFRFDRLARLTGGVILVLTSASGLSLQAMAGVMLVVSGAAGHCPFYALLGINRRLRSTNRVLANLPAHNPEPVFMFASHGPVVFRNAAATANLAAIESLDSLVEPADQQRLMAGETICAKRAQADITYMIALKKTPPEPLIMGYGFDITKLEDAQQQLYQDAITDRLTGLYNRKKLLDDTQEYTGPQALILMDLRGFGEINSFYGHDLGDAYLQGFARLFRDGVSARASLAHAVYRLHADVFAVRYSITGDSDLTCQREALALAEQLMAHYRQQEIVVGETIHLFIELTAGLALTPPAAVRSISRHAIINHAETALLEAKRCRLPLLGYFQLEQIEAQYRHNLYWSKKIKAVLHGQDEARLIAHFQPIQAIASGAIAKYEALVRLQEGEHLIAPGEFLAAAKKLGLLPVITETMLTLAADQLQQMDCTISVNVSAQDFAGGQLHEMLAQHIEGNGLNPERLTLEVLEDEEFAGHEAYLGQLRQAGYQIAIDDFGAGYSNFAQIQNIGPDFVKIDGSLIKDLATSDRNLPVIRSLVAYAASMGAKTIAEFVSSEAIYYQLQSLGVDYAQGYYVGKPGRVCIAYQTATGLSPG